MNMVRAMLYFKGIKLYFWAEAARTAIYLRNRSPSSALHQAIPYEVWFGYPPSIQHLRIFGSTCYALIPKDKRNKLQHHSFKCIFLGYSESSKAYRLYDEANKKLIITCDVAFCETSKNVEDIECQHLEELSKSSPWKETSCEILHSGGTQLI